MFKALSIHFKDLKKHSFMIKMKKICSCPFIVAYLLVAVGSSGILKGKQTLGVTFNSDKLGGIDFTKFSKLTMCSRVSTIWEILEILKSESISLKFWLKIFGKLVSDLL